MANFQNVAGSQCFIDIYPYEGGQYTMQSGQVISCSVSKYLKADQGTFNIQLTPGGPNGLNQPPYWVDIITPMSIAIIGMRRGNNQNITMIGVVKNVSTSESWVAGQGVQRILTVTGVDFSYFFTKFTYYSLWWLGATGVGVSNSPQTGAALTYPSILQGGGGSLLSGNPGDIGDQWFEQIMLNTYKRTQFAYNGTLVPFPNAMAFGIENYDATVPYGDNFVTAEGSWLTKFQEIFPFPWYEFFVITTTSVGSYSSDSTHIGSGYSFQSQGLGSSITAAPTLIARRNPIPVLTVTGNQTQFTINGVDTSLWDSLENFTLDAGSNAFISSRVSLNEDTVFNFYSLNPTWMRTLFGGANNSVVPAIFTFAAGADQDSIDRYGFRPANASFNWFADINGTSAGQGTALSDVQGVAATVLARYISYFHPTPLMASAEVSTWLRPDILPGCTFTYAPFKGEPTWDFYIEGVTHDWRFGGPSTTTLSLSRGLPSAVYADNGSGGMLQGVLTGTAGRESGVYMANVNQTGLVTLNQSQFQSFLSNWTPVYAQAQGI